MKRAVAVARVIPSCLRAVAAAQQKILVVVLALACSALAIHAQQGPPPLSVTPNVNVMSGVTDQFVGDKFLQRQNEPVVGVSTVNPDHLFAAGNDYRSVDFALDTGTGESGQQSSDSGEGSWARGSGKTPIVARNGRTRAKS